MSFKRKEGLLGYLKPGTDTYHHDKILREGEVFVLKKLTREDGGEFYSMGKWVWYVKATGFHPGSGQWWNDNDNRGNMRLRLTFKSTQNPFLKFTEGCQSG